MVDTPLNWRRGCSPFSVRTLKRLNTSCVRFGEDKIRSEFIRKWESSSEQVRLLFNLELNKIDLSLERKGYLEDLIKSHSELSISLNFDNKKQVKTLSVIFIIYILSMYFSVSIFQQIIFSSIFLFLSMKYFFDFYKIHNHISYIRRKRNEYEDELRYYEEIVYSNLPKYYFTLSIKSDFQDIYSDTESYDYFLIKKYEFLSKKLDECHNKLNDWSFNLGH